MLKMFVMDKRSRALLRCAAVMSVALIAGGGCATFDEAHSSLHTTDLGDGLMRYQLPDAESHHRRQESPTTCSAACLRMYYGLTGREDVEETVLLERHQRDFHQWFEGHGNVADLVASLLRAGGHSGREEQVLHTWEIEDGLVTGHIEDMSKRGILVVELVNLGLPPPARQLHMNRNDIARAIYRDAQPVIVSLVEKCEMDVLFEDERHAVLVVSVTMQGGKPVRFGVLDPLEEPTVIDIGLDEFMERLRYAGNEPSIRRANAARIRWVERHKLDPGLYARLPVLGPVGEALGPAVRATWCGRVRAHRFFRARAEQ